MQTRLVFLDAPNASLRLSVTSALRAAGVAFAEAAAGCASTVAVIRHLTPSTRAALRTECATRNPRVLAVVCEPLRAVTDSWTILAQGASDVMLWEGPRSADAVHDRLERWQRIDAVVASPSVQGTLIGSSRVWQAVLRQVVEAALYTEVPILLHGATGTGKELVARLAHSLDPRRSSRDLVLVDSTTLIDELAGSELFGHERGAFTGASVTRDGACALAHGGTLFLDEVGELRPRLQPELLRVVQEGEYKRVGSNTWRQADFRLVCATNRDLREEVVAGRFRPDLYYRIAGIVCRLPPLDERPGDILPLVRHFIAVARPDMADAGIELDPAVCDLLVTRKYHGNVRELRQLVARILHRHAGIGPITIGDVPEDERPDSGMDGEAAWREPAFLRTIERALAMGASLRDIRRRASDVAVQIALQESTSLSAAARRLGVTGRALQLRRASVRDKEVPLDQTGASDGDADGD